jgi:hypothetical protein
MGLRTPPPGDVRSAELASAHPGVSSLADRNPASTWWRCPPSATAAQRKRLIRAQPHDDVENQAA